MTVSPSTITATLDIKQRDVPWTIQSVPIFKETPAGFEENYVVKYEPQIKNVAVTGPPEQIELLKKEGAFKYKAHFEVSTFDKIGDLKKRLVFDLPPGVSLTPEAQAQAEWPVTIRERER